jgi:hypothetical protein
LADFSLKRSKQRCNSASLRSISARWRIVWCAQGQEFIAYMEVGFKGMSAVAISGIWVLGTSGAGSEVEGQFQSGED